SAPYGVSADPSALTPLVPLSQSPRDEYALPKEAGHLAERTPKPRPLHALSVEGRANTKWSVPCQDRVAFLFRTPTTIRPLVSLVLRVSDCCRDEPVPSVSREETFHGSQMVFGLSGQRRIGRSGHIHLSVASALNRRAEQTRPAGCSTAASDAVAHRSGGAVFQRRRLFPTRRRGRRQRPRGPIVSRHRHQRSS